MTGFFETAGMLLAMVGIIAAAWGVSRFLGKKFGMPSAGKSIQVLEQVSLGAERSLVLVRCRGCIYFLGNSQAGIHMLDKIEEAGEIREEEDESE